MHPNADTCAWSAPGKFTKITAEEAANYLGMDTSYLTTEKCAASKQYKEACMGWNKQVQKSNQYYNDNNRTRVFSTASQ